jgi:hypothetical protein
MLARLPRSSTRVKGKKAIVEFILCMLSPNGGSLKILVQFAQPSQL